MSYADRLFIDVALQKKYVTQPIVDQCLKIQQQMHKKISIGEVMRLHNFIGKKEYDEIEKIVLEGHQEEKEKKKEKRARDRKFAEVVLKEKLITEIHLVECVSLQREKEKRGEDIPLSEILVQKEYIKPEDVFYIEQGGAPRTSQYQSEEIAKIIQEESSSGSDAVSEKVEEKTIPLDQILSDEEHLASEECLDQTLSLSSEEKQALSNELSPESDGRSPSLASAENSPPEQEMEAGDPAADVLSQAQEEFPFSPDLEAVGDYRGPALMVTEGQDQGAIFPLCKAQLTIGRVKGADIQINDGTVSRIHCKLEYEDANGWVLIDMMSTHGVYVNGVRIKTRQVLCHQDTDRKSVV